mmetsp:Transcript_4191/g.8445  ORF Transcript_4191/g.8445 Transcript_4191/m.8445 type:complete len:97 (-) Transcript_4191:2196-2486(-)
MTSVVRSSLASPLRASCTEFSVTVSKALVASSSTQMSGFLSRHLAMATLCFSPPLSFRPLSPTMVSQPSVCDSMKVRMLASLAAFSRSSKLASLFP